jgi:Tol biopolymer transport system component
MRLLAACMILTMASVANATSPAAPAAAPTIFAPDVIAGNADDGAAAFTPDGNTVIFMRGTDSFTLMESHRDRGRWSAPRAASFSGHWRDLDPAMAPDGSFLLFVSNRPTDPGGQPLDAVHASKRRAGQGMNLWRVDRRGDSWGTPLRLPDIINRCSMTFAPSIAADGSIYFIGCEQADGPLRLLHAGYRTSHYDTPVRVLIGSGDAIVRDPAVAPDRSFLVISMKPAGSHQPYRLAITFHSDAGWSMPIDLGDTVNRGKHSMGAQLGPNHRTLYFYSDRRLPPSDPRAAARWNNGDDHIWQVSLAPWLDSNTGRGH